MEELDKRKRDVLARAALHLMSGSSIRPVSVPVFVLLFQEVSKRFVY